MKLRTGREAWKVVTADRESVLPLFLKHKGGHKEIIEILRRRKITKQYKIGSIIKAAKCASPILCFNTKKLACAWLWEYSHVLKNVEVIKVIGYQREEVRVLPFFLEDWFKFLQTGKMINVKYPWIGTLGFRKIKVIT